MDVGADNIIKSERERGGLGNIEKEPLHFPMASQAKNENGHKMHAM